MFNEIPIDVEGQNFVLPQRNVVFPVEKVTVSAAEAPNGYSSNPISREQLGDVLELDDLAMIAMSDTPPDHAPPRLTIEELEDAFDQGHIFEGMFNSDGSLVAYAWYEEREDELYFSSMAVHPGYRDKGLGSYFLTRADELARSKQLPKCTLSVDPFNSRGLHSFFKHGYRVSNYITNYFGEKNSRTDRFWMVKPMDDIGESEIASSLSIPCHQSDEIIVAITAGYTGISLERSQDGDSRNNRVTFVK